MPTSADTFDAIRSSGARQAARCREVTYGERLALLDSAFDRPDDTGPQAA